jgi:divalent metal cation (Fe/Co/Zn/Cd) transporter
MKRHRSGEITKRECVSARLATIPRISDQALHVLPIAPARADAVRRARLLAWIGLGWHVVEAAVALGAGVLAGSVALVGFGADSLIEAFAGIVVIWLMTDARAASPTAERRAQQLIAVSFGVLAAYIGVEAIRDLVSGHRPDGSWVGIGLAAVTLATMPPLARAKRRVAERLGSSATASESRQTMLCGYLSAALLVGLLANAALGWWWADPLTALIIGGVAVREARDSWRGDSCSCCA